jgi:hypothetical protein
MEADDTGKACGFTGMTIVTQRLCGYTCRKGNTWEPRCRLQDNIRMDLKDIEWDGLECIYQLGPCDGGIGYLVPIKCK